MVDNSDIYGHAGPRSAANRKLRRRLFDRDGRAKFERQYGAHCAQLQEDYYSCTKQGWLHAALITPAAVDWFEVELKAFFEFGEWGSSLNRFDKSYFHLAFDDIVEPGVTLDGVREDLLGRMNDAQQPLGRDLLTH